MGARIALIDVHAGYARLLEARGERGDRRRAEELRDEADRRPWPPSASVATGCSTSGPRVGAHARRRESREAGGRRPRRSSLTIEHRLVHTRRTWIHEGGPP